MPSDNHTGEQTEGQEEHGSSSKPSFPATEQIIYSACDTPILRNSKVTEQQGDVDDDASDISLETRYDAPLMRSQAVLTSGSAFDHSNIGMHSRSNYLVASENNFLTNNTADLLSSDSDLLPPPYLKLDNGIATYIESLLIGLPAPPRIRLRPTTADIRSFLKDPSRDEARVLSKIFNALEKSSEDSTNPIDFSIDHIGRIVRRLVQPPTFSILPSQKWEDSVIKKNDLMYKEKGTEEWLNEQAQLDLATKMSLAEDNEDIDLESVLKMSLSEVYEGVDPTLRLKQAQLEEAMQQSALGMRSEVHHSRQVEDKSNRTLTDDNPARNDNMDILLPTSALNSNDEFANAMMSVVLCAPPHPFETPINLSNLALPTTNSTLSPTRELPSMAVTDSTQIIVPFIRGGPFRFKEMPLEVKEIIYKLLVVIRPATYALNTSRMRVHRRLYPHIPSGDTAIFFADKQISEEARAVFYSHNIFAIGNDRYGLPDRTCLEGLQEFVGLVPRLYRRMVQSIELKILLPGGWLEEEISDDSRDAIEKHVQVQLLGLGKILRKKFRGVRNVRAVFMENEHRLGTLKASVEKQEIKIAISKQEKRDALQGLLQFPALHNVHVDMYGPVDVKTAFLEFAKDMVDSVDGLQSEPENERERGVVRDEREISEQLTAMTKVREAIQHGASQGSL